MSKKIISIGRVAAFTNSVHSLSKQYKCLDLLKNMPDKTGLEINAYKGLKRSLTCKWIVGVLVTILIAGATILLLQAGNVSDMVLGGYNVETSYVKEGYIRYGTDDAEYYVGDLGYEENTWLYIFGDEESGMVDHVEDMQLINDEIAAIEQSYFVKSGIVYMVAFVILILGIILALAIFEKPFRQWSSEYSVTHPGWYDRL